MAAQRKSARYSKKERADLQRNVDELAQKIADRKERTRVVQVEIELCTLRARHNRRRLQGLKVGVLGLEDVNERSKTKAEIEDIEREVNDSLFKLATKRSDARRNLGMIKECEEKLAIIQKALQASL